MTGLYKTILHIALCGVIQVALGWPFLTTYPISYISRSFELGRVFMYKWTVNWKFLDEEVRGGKRLIIDDGGMAEPPLPLVLNIHRSSSVSNYQSYCWSSQSSYWCHSVSNGSKMAHP